LHRRLQGFRLLLRDLRKRSFPQPEFASGLATTSRRVGSNLSANRQTSEQLSSARRTS
jgi:hypothetical protein